MDRLEATISAAIKAMEDVIIPAVDPADPLASEQGELVRDLLSFLKERVYSVHAKAIIELNNSTCLLEEVIEYFDELSTDCQQEAQSVLVENQRILQSAIAHTTDVHRANARALALVRTLIRGLHTESPNYSKVKSAVLSTLEESEEFQRSWYEPLGFDRWSDELPAFEKAVNDALASIERHRNKVSAL